MNKLITIIAASSIAAAASSYGQTLIAATDFSGFDPNAQSISANFSDLAIDGPASAPFGTLSFTPGATEPFPLTQFSSINVPAGISLNSSNRIAGVNDEFNAGGSLLAQDLGFLGTSDGGFFDFAVNAGGDVMDSIEFGFAASVAQAGDSIVSVSYSLDGGSSFTDINNALTVDALQSAGGEAFSFAVAGSATDAVFRVGFADIANGINFDNVQVSGVVSPVPEPSTYAAIAGVLALAFVAYRRRK